MPLRAEAIRLARRHEAVGQDQRAPYQRDCDRILYSSAFRRLSGVGQVVRAGEGDVFHNRLIHSLKVAQIGRRLAEDRQAKQGALCAAWGLDGEVVAAACLAHDLGHPPFGHLGERVLNELVLGAADLGGFEGNAQTFRIVTKLSVRFEETNGLDLTRATLSAILKYPWLRDPADSLRRKKWNAYETEKGDFDFARDGLPEGRKTAEAELMDWSDDIAYSVHDVEDFHRCRAIPWYSLTRGSRAQTLVDHGTRLWQDPPADAAKRLQAALERLMRVVDTLTPALLHEPYEGLRSQRREVRFLTSYLISRYFGALTLRPFNPGERCVEIDETLHDEIRILKQITRDYVIGTPALAAQQQGQSTIVRDLFADLMSDLSRSERWYFPIRFRHLIDVDGSSKARVVADCISSLSEAEAIQLHGRLRGYSGGSVLDPIVR